MGAFLIRVARYQVGRISCCSMMRAMRDSRPYAFLQGFYERATEGDCAGRTHDESMDWNEAYDAGMNLADRLVGER